MLALLHAVSHPHGEAESRMWRLWGVLVSALFVSVPRLVSRLQGQCSCSCSCSVSGHSDAHAHAHAIAFRFNRRPDATSQVRLLNQEIMSDTAEATAEATAQPSSRKGGRKRQRGQESELTTDVERNHATTDDATYPRRRVSRACEVCRLRKTRCDAAQPSCAFCRGQGIRCVYRKSFNTSKRWVNHRCTLSRELQPPYPEGKAAKGVLLALLAAAVHVSAPEISLTFRL